jgi:enamine deaminase RidA (YjgF/YER057c/UK114 family)
VGAERAGLDVYTRLDRLGITLPASPPPVANFQSHAQARGLLFLSGQGPVKPDGSAMTGTVGVDVSIDDAYQHARLVGINLLAVMHEATGDLNRIARIVKVLGMVNAVPGFVDHPRVINGCSDLFIEVFGAAGHHARSAVGMGSLPGHITVEIEGVAELRDGGG